MFAVCGEGGEGADGEWCTVFKCFWFGAGSVADWQGGMMGDGMQRSERRNRADLSLSKEKNFQKAGTEEMLHWTGLVVGVAWRRSGKARHAVRGSVGERRKKRTRALTDC